MPYDLPFERIADVDNQSALELNQAIAAELIALFPEVYDLNPANSSSHFTQREIDSEDEFPERHFRLCAEVGEMNFDFEFWKNAIWLELGAGGDPNHRFAQVQKYAAFIMQQGFTITTSSNDGPVELAEALAWHLREYRDWVGFVAYVAKAVATNPPTTTS